MHKSITRGKKAFNIVVVVIIIFVEMNGGKSAE